MEGWGEEEEGGLMETVGGMGGRVGRLYGL